MHTKHPMEALHTPRYKKSSLITTVWAAGPKELCSASTPTVNNAVWSIVSHARGRIG